MTLDDSTLLWFALSCAGLVTVALLMSRSVRRSVPARAGAWLLLSAGLAGLALLAFAQLTGRLGAEHLWFRAPSFYVASVTLTVACIWWLRRPAAPLVRFGVPVAALGCAALAMIAGRIDGRAAPVAMLLPTLDTPAPPLTYFDLQGGARTLAELRGQVVLVNFWATWCVPCRREMPMLANMQREHADEGLVVLYVSLEEPDVIADFLARHPYEGIHGRLDHAAEFYAAGKIYPMSYLITRDGRVAGRWSGRPREDWLAAQIAARL